MAKYPFLKQQALPAADQFNAIIANNDKIANSPAVNPVNTFVPAPSYDDGKYNNDVVMHKGTTPGVSTPSATPTTAQTPYELWKEMYGQQAQLMPAQSYTDWLMAGGMAGAAQKQYDATVRTAETDYEKSKALYGANAERLGRAGSKPRLPYVCDR